MYLSRAGGLKGDDRTEACASQEMDEFGFATAFFQFGNDNGVLLSLLSSAMVLITGMGRRVGRVTPCAPFARRHPWTGAHEVTRPTNLTRWELLHPVPDAFHIARVYTGLRLQ